VFFGDIADLSSVCVAAIVLLIAATSLDSHSPEMPYDMIGIMIPATIEVNFAVVSGESSYSL
jgi:hypothetical protein